CAIARDPPADEARRDGPWGGGARARRGPAAAAGAGPDAGLCEGHDFGRPLHLAGRLPTAGLRLAGLALRLGRGRRVGHYLPAGRDPGGRGEHRGRGTVLLMGPADGMFDEVRPEPLAADQEVEMDLGEDLGVGTRPFRFEPDLATADRLATLAQYQDDVVGGAAPRAEQHHLHGARGEVVAASLRGSVHYDRMPATRLGEEAHAGPAGPPDLALHISFLRNRRRTRPGLRDCARFPFWAPAAVPTLADPAAPGANLVAMRHPATAAGRKTSEVFSNAVLAVGLRGGV